jgi:hypothetical protein
LQSSRTSLTIAGQDEQKNRTLAGMMKAGTIEVKGW